MKSVKTFLSEKEKNKLKNFLSDLGYTEDKHEEKPVLFFKEYITLATINTKFFS